MSSTQMSGTQMKKVEVGQVASPATVELKLEVVVIPVADVDRAKRFYEGLGWRVDADFTNGTDWRGVQVTPPGSACSIQFGTSLTTLAAGSLQGTYLVVDDIEAARTELIGLGVEVSEPFHFEAFGGPPLPGLAPDHKSYGSYASFKDPDGNGWLLQEVKTRLPGRGLPHNVATLTELLREAEQRHGPYEATAAKHHWSDFYSAYVFARQQGRTPDEAAADGARNVERARA